MSILRKSLARPDDKGRSGRERSSRRCKFPLTSSFRSLVAHPGRRRHPAPRDRPRHGPDRDPLAHRRIRRTAGGTRGPPRNRQAQPLAGGRDGDPPWPDHPHRSARRPAQRRRPDHRPRCPSDVKAVQWIRHAHHVPAPAPYAAGEISVAGAAERLHCSIGVVYDWIKTGKLTAPPRTRQPALHPLGRQHPRRIPLPDNRVRPPQPSIPPHHTPRLHLSRGTMSVPAGTMFFKGWSAQPHPTRRSQHAIAERAV